MGLQLNTLLNTKTAQLSGLMFVLNLTYLSFNSERHRIPN
jgi:hypothetical protein